MNQSQQTILVVDPDPDFLAWADKHLGTPVTRILRTTSGDEALALFQKEKPDLMIVEMHMPFSGMQLLQRVRQHDPNAMIILTTGFPTTSAIIEAMKYGAYEFLRKETLPYDLRPVVEGALKAKEALNASEQDLPMTPAFPDELAKEHIIGNSPAMQAVFKMVGRVSRSNAPVMITGESGCGKEVVAKAIHHFSMRASNDFVAINCAAIPSNLLESELFGHEKGAFTGAVTRRVGRFEQCTNGTLFLDEIGDMPLEVQSKILRVLQEGQFSRVGGNATLTTDARILAATNKNLEQEVSRGKFREDLFYRLNVVRIHIPPLRQRRDDIPLLAKFFLQRLTGKTSGKHRFSDDAMQMLIEHDWPGNVRELENTIQRAVVLANTSLLLPRDIPLGQVQWERRPDKPSPVEEIHQAAAKAEVPIVQESRYQPTNETPTNLGKVSVEDAVQVLLQAAEDDPEMELLPWLEREMTLHAMQRTDNNQVRASKLLGITRATLRKRLERYQIGREA